VIHSTAATTKVAAASRQQVVGEDHCGYAVGLQVRPDIETEPADHNKDAPTMVR